MVTATGDLLDRQEGGCRVTEVVEANAGLASGGPGGERAQHMRRSGRSAFDRAVTDSRLQSLLQSALLNSSFRIRLESAWAPQF
jgi:hypothetical protein